MKTFLEYFKSKNPDLYLEFDPNRNKPGRATPLAIDGKFDAEHRANKNAKELGLRRTGKRDQRCDSIQDPYQNFKCKLMISAKNSMYGFNHLIPDNRPWDQQPWSQEELDDLQKAYDDANWQHKGWNDNKMSAVYGKGPQYNAAELAEKIRLQKIAINKARLKKI